MELGHCPDFDKLRQQFAGARYSELVEEHMRKTGQGIELAEFAYIETLSQAEMETASELIDEFNRRALIHGFLQKDCREAFDAICNRFNVMMKKKGQVVANQTKFAVFQVVTLNFACMARDDERYRKHAGIAEKDSRASKGLFSKIYKSIKQYIHRCSSHKKPKAKEPARKESQFRQTCRALLKKAGLEPDPNLDPGAQLAMWGLKQNQKEFQSYEDHAIEQQLLMLETPEFIEKVLTGALTVQDEGDLPLQISPEDNPEEVAGFLLGELWNTMRMWQTGEKG